MHQSIVYNAVNLIIKLLLHEDKIETAVCEWCMWMIAYAVVRHVVGGPACSLHTALKLCLSPSTFMLGN